MILFKCDRCGQVISPLVYKIGFEAFTNRDFSTNNPINSPWAHEGDPDFQKDDLSERIYTLHLCRNCVEEISAVILNSDKTKNSEGGVPATHSTEPVREPEPQPEPAEDPDTDGELTEAEEQKICDRIAGNSPKKLKRVDEDAVMRMRAEKRSPKAISEELGCHISTVYNILKRREGNLFQGTAKSADAMAIAMRER